MHYFFCFADALDRSDEYSLASVKIDPHPQNVEQRAECARIKNCTYHYCTLRCLLLCLAKYIATFISTN